jgi:hypothetical protein
LERNDTNFPLIVELRFIIFFDRESFFISFN